MWTPLLGRSIAKASTCRVSRWDSILKRSASSPRNIAWTSGGVAGPVAFAAMSYRSVSSHAGPVTIGRWMSKAKAAITRSVALRIVRFPELRVMYGPPCGRIVLAVAGVDLDAGDFEGRRGGALREGGAGQKRAQPDWPHLLFPLPVSYGLRPANVPGPNLPVAVLP